MQGGFELVVKIGSMALIRKADRDMDYNVFSRLGAALRPGMILVSSGATEIGRLDYIKRTGCELCGDNEQNKVDYAAQGQSILMTTYREFVRPEYGLRQVLVEHNHFNDAQRKQHIKGLLFRAREQNAIPIINYNDAVSDEESRKMELAHYMQDGARVVECVDNDETAAVIASLVQAKTLLLLTSTQGIYADPGDPQTLVRQVMAHSAEELTARVRELQSHCVGASRAGANGAGAKLAFALKSALEGVQVVIGSAQHSISSLLDGSVPCTRIGIKRA